jgi:hypothetical protein
VRRFRSQARCDQSVKLFIVKLLKATKPGLGSLTALERHLGGAASH